MGWVNLSRPVVEETGKKKECEKLSAGSEGGKSSKRDVYKSSALFRW